MHGRFADLVRVWTLAEADQIGPIVPGQVYRLVNKLLETGVEFYRYRGPVP